MKGPTIITKVKSLSARRLRRSVLLLGMVGATAGAAMFTAASAQAAVGSQPGNLQLSPATGPSSSTPTWSTTTACPTGFQGSAVLFALNQNGSVGSQIGVGTQTAVTAPFGGSLVGSVGALISTGTDVPVGTPDEWVVGCFASTTGTGTPNFVQSIFVTVTAGGTYTTSSTGPVVTATSTSLTASPTPATAGSPVTLTATEIAADNTHPAGSVQFQANGTNIGSPVAVNASGVATTSATFAAAGTESLSAVFTPTPTTYSGSTGNATLTVVPAGALSGSEPLAVTVPQSGTFTLTVAPGTVNLTATGLTATGALQPITVSDTRNTFPGWSVTGQAADFTGSGTAAGSTISGNQLGWTPTGTVSDGTLGGTVGVPRGIGSTAAVLASAAVGHGFGTSNLGATLNLIIPASAAAGPYTSTLTVTAIPHG